MKKKYQVDMLLIVDERSSFSTSLTERYATKVRSVKHASRHTPSLLYQVGRLGADGCILADLNSSVFFDQMRTVRDNYPDVPVYVFGSFRRIEAIKKATTLGIDGLFDSSLGLQSLFEFLESEAFKGHVTYNREDPAPSTVAVSPGQKREVHAGDQVDEAKVESFVLACRTQSSNQFVTQIKSHRAVSTWAIESRRGSDSLFAAKEVFLSAGIDTRKITYPQLEPIDESDEGYYCFLPGFPLPEISLLEKASFFVIVHYQDNALPEEYQKLVEAQLKLDPLSRRPLDRIEYFSRFIEIIRRANLSNEQELYLNEPEIEKIVFFSELDSFSAFWSWMESLQPKIASRDVPEAKTFCDTWGSMQGKVEEVIADEYTTTLRNHAGTDPGEELLNMLGFPMHMMAR